jgi:hypothetical protein
MTRTIVIPDDLYARLGALARPFQDKEAADVIRWLVESNGADGTLVETPAAIPPLGDPGEITGRAPRERGAIVDLDGVAIKAHTVPDLCAQVMDFLYAKDNGKKLLELAPYSTSAKRYLFAKTPFHPNGNGFVSPIKCHGLHVETHKNYKTAITQLARLSYKLGFKLTYKGT